MDKNWFTGAASWHAGAGGKTVPSATARASSTGWARSRTRPLAGNSNVWREIRLLLRNSNFRATLLHLRRRCRLSLERNLPRLALVAAAAAVVVAVVVVVLPSCKHGDFYRIRGNQPIAQCAILSKNYIFILRILNN